MNWDRIQGNWKQFQGRIKKRWGKLTDDDMMVISGEREQLDRQAVLGGVQCVRRAGESGADHEAVGVESAHRSGGYRLRAGKIVRLKSTAVAEWVRAPMLMTSTPGSA